MRDVSHQTEVAAVVGMAAIIFFFQAEDGIRDYKVTGVQTCALPISRLCGSMACCISLDISCGDISPVSHLAFSAAAKSSESGAMSASVSARAPPGTKIGRASCRERV